MDREPTPEEVARFHERQELMRRAAQNLLDHKAAGRKCDPHALKWAERIVARIKPATNSLTSGEPKQ